MPHPPHKVAIRIGINWIFFIETFCFSPSLNFRTVIPIDVIAAWRCCNTNSNTATACIYPCSSILCTCEISHLRLDSVIAMRTLWRFRLVSFKCNLLRNPPPTSSIFAEYDENFIRKESRIFSWCLINNPMSSISMPHPPHEIVTIKTLIVWFFCVLKYISIAVHSQCP